MRPKMASLAKLFHKFSHPKPRSTELLDRVVKSARSEQDSEAHKVRSHTAYTHTRRHSFLPQLFRSRPGMQSIPQPSPSHLSPGHTKKGVLPDEVHPEEETVPGVVHPGSTGVASCLALYKPTLLTPPLQIYCSDRAIANGFSYANSHEWANFGQGAPEGRFRRVVVLHAAITDCQDIVGPIPGAPPRVSTIEIDEAANEYAPTTGLVGMSLCLAVPVPM